MKVVQNVDIKRIVPNPLDERSMDPDQILVLADAIKQTNFVQPIVAYKDGDEYIVVSGHRRLQALKSLGSTKTMLIGIDKPHDFTEEAELLSRANMHRSTPQDIQYEAINANDIWRKMDNSRKMIPSTRMMQRAAWKDSL